MTRSVVGNPGYVGSPDLPTPDWLVLRDAIVESLTTSPGAFLTTIDQVKAESPEFWQDKLRSAQWAVVQHGEQIVGIAAAKPPAATDEYASPDKACFIESVWIDPAMREKGVGQRLVSYVIERQRQVGIQEFYLWVVDDNDPAIRLYNRMHFKQTGRNSDHPETQFLLKFDSDVVDYEELWQGSDSRSANERELGITYRMLSADH